MVPSFPFLGSIQKFRHNPTSSSSSHMLLAIVATFNWLVGCGAQPCTQPLSQLDRKSCYSLFNKTIQLCDMNDEKLKCEQKSASESKGKKCANRSHYC